MENIQPAHLPRKTVQEGVRKIRPSVDRTGIVEKPQKKALELEVLNTRTIVKKLDFLLTRWTILDAVVRRGAKRHEDPSSVGRDVSKEAMANERMWQEARNDQAGLESEIQRLALYLDREEFEGEMKRMQGDADDPKSHGAAKHDLAVKLHQFLSVEEGLADFFAKRGEKN